MSLQIRHIGLLWLVLRQIGWRWLTMKLGQKIMEIVERNMAFGEYAKNQCKRPIKSRGTIQVTLRQFEEGE